jgi:hypothetical protein
MAVSAVVVEAIKITLGSIIGRVEIRGADCTMVCSWMMFTKKVGLEEHGVGALDICVALGEATNFFGIGAAPQVALAAFAELSTLGDVIGIRSDRIVVKDYMVEEGNIVGDIVGEGH